MRSLPFTLFLLLSAGELSELFAESGKMAKSDLGGRHQHDRGLVRFQLGFGYGDFTSSADNTDAPSIAGRTTFIRTDFGWCLWENVALFLGFSGEAARAEIDQTTTRVRVFNAGGGVTYFFMPSNVYVSAALASVELDDRQQGFSIHTSVGKEWWISENWGLGAALIFYYGTATAPNDAKYRNIAGGIVFSATYN